MDLKTINKHIEQLIVDRLVTIAHELNFDSRDLDDMLEVNKTLSSHPRTRTSRKVKEKDPNAPKRPNNPYVQYCKERRPLLKQQYPDLQPKDVMRELARMWREEDPTIKQQYSQQYQLAKAQAQAQTTR